MGKGPALTPLIEPPQIWDHFWVMKPPQIWDHFASHQCPRFGTILHHINAPNLGPLLGRPVRNGSSSHPPHRTTPNLGQFQATSMPQIWDHFASHQCPKFGSVLHHINAPNLGPFCVTSMPQIWDHFWGVPLGTGPHLTPPIEPPQIWDPHPHPHPLQRFHNCPKSGTTFGAPHWGRVQLSPPP